MSCTAQLCLTLPHTQICSQSAAPCGVPILPRGQLSPRVEAPAEVKKASSDVDKPDLHACKAPARLFLESRRCMEQQAFKAF